MNYKSFRVRTYDKFEDNFIAPIVLIGNMFGAVYIAAKSYIEIKSGKVQVPPINESIPQYYQDIFARAKERHELRLAETQVPLKET